MTGIDRLTGLFRRFRSLVLNREVEVVGHCRLCGNCCRNILIQDGNRWLRTRAQYDRLVAEAPEHARFKAVDRDSAGHLLFTCSALADDNHCTCHGTRPALCRNYPPKSLYYRGGQIGADCGYAFKAVTFRDVFTRRRRFRSKPFADVLQQELEQEQDGQK